MTDSTRMAELAVMGSEAVALRAPDLEVFVRHSGPGKGKSVAGRPDADWFDDVLTFEVESVRCDVAVRFTRSPSRRPETEFEKTTLSDRTRAPRVELTQRLFMRHVPSNLYIGRNVVELLFVVDNQRRLRTFGDAWIMSELLRELSATALSAEAPILFMQAPVSPETTAPASGGTWDEAPRAVHGFAARIAIGVSQHDATGRMAMLTRLERFAVRQGIGMYLRDPRTGRARGDWWEMTVPNPARISEWRDELWHRFAVTRVGPDVAADRVELLTAVGPAQPGTTAAVFENLVRDGIGALAVSVAALHEIAAISVLVPTLSTKKKTKSKGSTALAVLGSMRERCSVSPLLPQLPERTETETGPGTRQPIVGYHAVRSGPFDWAEPVEGSYAIWVAWAIALWPCDKAQRTKKPKRTVSCRGLERSSVGARIAAELVKLDWVDSCSLVYERMRRDGMSNTGRGRAKLGLVLKDATSDLAQQLSVACNLVETKLSTDELTVRIGWRERWVGAWSIPT